MENDTLNDLKAIEEILIQKPEIENNPFSNVPIESIEKALEWIEGVL